ncbi:hypothetical protein Q5752_000798 [Cryptotrichosporon argae]
MSLRLASSLRLRLPLRPPAPAPAYARAFGSTPLCATQVGYGDPVAEKDSTQRSPTPKPSSSATPHPAAAGTGSGTAAQTGTTDPEFSTAGQGTQEVQREGNGGKRETKKVGEEPKKENNADGPIGG